MSASAVGLACHMLWHVAAALVLSTVVYATMRSWRLVLLCCVGSFYTDVDHLFEYTAVHGTTLNWDSIFSGFYFTQIDARYLWLHSYETFIFIWLLAWVGGRWRPAAAFSLGLLGHLVVDQLSYPLKPLAYSLIYRWWHGFDSSAFGL